MIDDTFEQDLENFKKRASYIFSNEKRHRWSIANWSKMTLPSAIEKYGSPQDKMNIALSLNPVNGKRKKPSEVSGRSGQHLRGP